MGDLELPILRSRFHAGENIGTAGREIISQNWWFVSVTSVRRGRPRGVGLVGFHEEVDGFLAALGADLEVVSVVGRGCLHHSHRLIPGVSISGISSNSNLSRSSTKLCFPPFSGTYQVCRANEAIT